MRTRRALAETFVWRQGNLLIYLVGLMVVSRLLPPAAFGVFAAAQAVHQFGLALADFGLPSQLIRSPERRLSREVLSSALGLSITITLATSLALGAIALFVPMVATMPGFGLALGLLAAALLTQPLILVGETELRRELEISLLVRIDVFVAVVNVGVTITAALAGLGAAAPALGLLVDNLARAAILLTARRALPAINPSFSGWRASLGFGGRYTTTALLPKAAEMVRAGLITWALGPASLGFLNRAQAITKITDQVLLDGIKPLILPVMAGALRDGTDGARVYLAKVNYLVAIFWPAGAVIAILAEPLVRILLGGTWSEAVPLVRILALGAAAYPFTRMSMNMFVALGAEQTLLRIQAVQQVVALSLVAVGAFISIEAVGVAITTALFIKAVRMTRALGAITNYSGRDMRRTMARGAAMTISAVAGPALMMLAPPAGALAAVLAGIALAAVGWFLGAWVTRHPLPREIVQAAEAMIRPQRSATPPS